MQVDTNAVEKRQGPEQQDKGADPFLPLIQDLKVSAEDAAKTWKQCEQNRARVFDDWCLLAINRVSNAIQDPLTRVEAFRLLANATKILHASFPLNPP